MININGTEFVINPATPLKAYICGVTPYNDSHCGHMRTYLAFDTIRKILKRYFGQDMFVVMNVTDIDDKIINQSHSLGVDFLDIARKYEKSFFDDMERLQIDPVNTVSRVTDYIDELIKFIQVIMKNGFAYESNGSVYFDTQAFSKKHNNNPFNLNLVDSDYDFEEEQSFSHEKKDKRDVSLWKAQKHDYEPAWENPFSHIKGRPSWSCECAVMSTSILGDKLDLHFGGIDLKFPHHQNEILQVIAYYDRPDSEYVWTKQFAHFGHLNIKGLKMSKSLKNFITIKEILNNYTPRQLRLLFLQHNWDQSLDYSEDNIQHAIALEKTLSEFIAFMEYIIRKNNYVKKWNHLDNEFNGIILTRKSNVDSFLRNNINTKDSILELQKLISETYNYLKNDLIQYGLLIDVNNFLIHILNAFGVNFNQQTSNSDNDNMSQITDMLVGFRDKVRIECFSINKKELVNKSTDELTQTVNNLTSNLLKASDNVRNDLTNLDIKIEDKGKNPSIWKKIT